MTKRIAVVGCGMRSNVYLGLLREAMGDQLQLVAAADPLAEHRRHFVSEYGTAKSREFESGAELVAAVGGELDGVIIGSPNFDHAKSAIPSFSLGIPILLEKPVATTRDECLNLWNAFVAAGRPPVMVGFVLRYTAFYRKVLEIVRGGRIGTLLSISAAELMGPSLTALFMRGWRRHHEIAGPLINEKCSHDLDILTQLAGSVPSAVTSFADRTYLIPRPEAGERCRDCTIRSTCHYDASRLPEYTLTPAAHFDSIASAPEGTAFNDLCVFTADASIPDHQVVGLEYPNGILGTFSVAMGQPRTTRTITICGTDGQINGVFEDNQIQIERYVSGSVRADREEVEHDPSAHGGGDSKIASHFEMMLRGEVSRSDVGLADGIQACLIGFAAEEARKSRRSERVELIDRW